MGSDQKRGGEDHGTGDELGSTRTFSFTFATFATFSSVTTGVTSSWAGGTVSHSGPETSINSITWIFSISRGALATWLGSLFKVGRSGGATISWGACSFAWLIFASASISVLGLVSFASRSTLTFASVLVKFERIITFGSASGGLSSNEKGKSGCNTH